MRLLQKAKYYTALDVRGAYNLIRMGDGEEWKTTLEPVMGCTNLSSCLSG
jgi:hypothetical protein